MIVFTNSSFLQVTSNGGFIECVNWKRAAQKTWMHAYLESKFNIPKQLLMGGWGGGGWMDNSKDLLNAVEALLYGSTIYNNKLEPVSSLSLSLSLDLFFLSGVFTRIETQRGCHTSLQWFSSSFSQGGFPQAFLHHIFPLFISHFIGLW